MLKNDRLFKDKNYLNLLLKRYGNSIFYINDIEDGNTVLHELITKRCCSSSETKQEGSSGYEDIEELLDYIKNDCGGIFLSKNMHPQISNF